MFFYLGAFALAIGVLITFHELGHFLAARWLGVKVLCFSVGFGKTLFSRKIGTDQIEWKIGIFPLGGYVKMLDEREGIVSPEDLPRAFNRQSVWKRFAIVVAGPLANFLLAIILCWGVFVVGSQVFLPPPVIGTLEQGSAAAQAGLQEGDRIFEIDGQPIAVWWDLVAAVRDAPGRQLRLSFTRQGRALKLTLVPLIIYEQGRQIGRIGVGSAQMTPQERAKWTKTVRYGPIESLVKAVEETWRISSMTVMGFGKMLLGQASWRNLAGPITIADYAGQSAHLGLVSYLQFLALISVNLGVLNLFPIPLLDGGHLMYYIAEIIKGSPISERAIAIGQQIGLALLAMLMAFSFYNDINRFLITYLVPN